MAFASGYDPTEAGICMTLSSLSYVSENDPPKIKSSLITALQNKSFATKGNWELVWGPALSPDNGNLLYVARDKTKPARYAIVTRGTDICFLSNIEEDIYVWKQSTYPYNSPPGLNPKVADGTLQGVKYLLTTLAPGTLSEFLARVNSQEAELFITGHSLGGALATLLCSWALDNRSKWKSPFKFKAYTFAAPSIGNGDYATYFGQQLSKAGAESYRVWSQSDAFPHFWDNYIELPYLNYPGYSMPWEVRLSLITITGVIDYYFTTYNIAYSPVATSHPLSNPSQYPDCANMPAKTTVEMLEQYMCYVMAEHASDNYLRLLGAPPTNVGYDSTCPPPAVPQNEPR